MVLHCHAFNFLNEKQNKKKKKVKNCTFYFVQISVNLIEMSNRIDFCFITSHSHIDIFDKISKNKWKVKAANLG